MATTDTFAAPARPAHAAPPGGAVPPSLASHARRRHAPVQVSAGERARVFRQAKRHSVLVKALRVVCPIAAVLSVGLYFTNKRIVLDVGAGKFTGQIPTISGDNLKMENPRYEGFTTEGAKFNVAAKTGYQDFRNPARIKLITIEAHLTQLNDEWAHLASDEGMYDTKGDSLDLSGNIKVTSSNGLTVHMKTANVGTKTQIVTTKDPVIVEMGNGTTVESDGMVLNAKTKEVTFEGNVRSHLVRDQAQKPEAGKAKGSTATLRRDPAMDGNDPAVARRDTEQDAGTAPKGLQQGAQP